LSPVSIIQELLPFFRGCDPVRPVSSHIHAAEKIGLDIAGDRLVPRLEHRRACPASRYGGAVIRLRAPGQIVVPGVDRISADLEIHRCGHAVAQGGLLAEWRIDDVKVSVDEARGHHMVPGVDCLGTLDFFRGNRDDFSALHTHVANRIEVCLGVHDPAARDHKIVVLCESGCSYRCGDSKRREYA
jgi:hypothetical protein